MIDDVIYLKLLFYFYYNLLFYFFVNSYDDDDDGDDDNNNNKKKKKNPHFLLLIVIFIAKSLLAQWHYPVLTLRRTSVQTLLPPLVISKKISYFYHYLICLFMTKNPHQGKILWTHLWVVNPE